MYLSKKLLKLLYWTWFEVLWLGSVLVQTSSSHRRTFTRKNHLERRFASRVELRYRPEKKKRTIGCAGRELVCVGRCWSAALLLFVSWSNFSRLGTKQKPNKTTKKQPSSHFMFVCLCCLTERKREKNPPLILATAVGKTPHRAPQK